MNNDIKSRLSLAFFWIFSFIIIIFIMCFRSHAASDQDYFPMEQNKNGHFSQAVIDAISSKYDDENYYIFVMYIDYNYRVIRYPKSEKTNGMICGEKSNNLQNFSLYMVGSINVQAWGFQYGYGQILNEVYYGSNPLGYFQNLPSSNYNSNYDYISNYKVFTNNTSSKLLVLNYDEQPEYSDPDNDTYPENFEQPKLSDYIDESTIPSFDNTDIPSSIGSLYNILRWSYGYLIPGLGNYIVDSINWGFQKIINNFRNVINSLQDAIEDFISPITSSLSDIKDFFDYITEPLDLDEIETALNSSTTYSLVNVASSLINTYQNYFDSITAPSSLSFHVPYTILTKTGFVDFDFSWYADIRDSVLPWIVGFLYMGFGLALFRSFPSIIHGVSGILQKGG